MKNTFKLLFIIIVCSFGFLSVYAAKPKPNDCRVVELIFGGGISKITSPITGKTTITIPDLTVICQHKDGKKETITLGEFTRSYDSEEDATKKALAEAAVEGLQKLKTEYCPQHGCNK
ncbi:hypothetical protein [Akkermansia sp.]|uniref:hypothetical protein n=1 Tax=Akkermansia sp. TaxID=1872421 RepID=UPI0025B87D47|nr:hypothetical protein [Akkermansia sp.]MCD8065134.1 hypothetical protein [Akkermansia sp.]